MEGKLFNIYIFQKLTPQRDFGKNYNSKRLEEIECDNTQQLTGIVIIW